MNDDLDLNDDPVPPPPLPSEHLPPELPKLKGGFTKEGRLYIERAGLPKSADCRFCTSVTEVRIPNDGSLNRDESAKIYRQGFGCTDHCGHLGEPVYQTVGPFQGLTMLQLCQGTTLFFIEFKDNRPKLGKPMVMKNG